MISFWMRIWRWIEVDYVPMRATARTKYLMEAIGRLGKSEMNYGTECGVEWTELNDGKSLSDCPLQFGKAIL